MSEDRNTEAEDVVLIKDPDELARREAENGVRQYRLAEKMILEAIQSENFRLRQGIILELHEQALQGIHRLAGTYRNSYARINQSNHVLPHHREVADHVADMCEYVNLNWHEKNAVQLYAYVLWRLNWIHPFADGNGRTARTLGYVVMSVKLRSFLPGHPTMPDLIDKDKSPYYRALETADCLWKSRQDLTLATMETYLEALLEKQLASAVQQAGL